MARSKASIATIANKALGHELGTAGLLAFITRGVEKPGLDTECLNFVRREEFLSTCTQL